MKKKKKTYGLKLGESFRKKKFQKVIKDCSSTVTEGMYKIVSLLVQVTQV